MVFWPFTVFYTIQLQLGIEKSVNYGWGIFGWINKYIFIPLFNFISSFMPFGISIIIMTIIVRLAMSPVTYRSYVSQVKMKILRPEIEEINKKFSKDAVKRQQETMSLYSRGWCKPNVRLFASISSVTSILCII